MLWLPDCNQTTASVDNAARDFSVVLVNVEELDLVGLLLDVNFLLPGQVLDDFGVGDGL